MPGREGSSGDGGGDKELQQRLLLVSCLHKLS